MILIYLESSPIEYLSILIIYTTQSYICSFLYTHNLLYLTCFVNLLCLRYNKPPPLTRISGQEFSLSIFLFPFPKISDIVKAIPEAVTVIPKRLSTA